MKLLLYIPLIITVFSATAQVGYGPEIGVGLSTFKFAPSTYPVDYTSASVTQVFSGRIGGITDAPLNRHIYFQAGLLLSLKGAERTFSYYRNDSFHESVRQTLNINYAELPLSVVFKSGMQGKGRFILGIGASPSYLLGGRNRLDDQQVFNDTPHNSNGTYKVAVGKTLHGFDIGVSVSAGYELATGLYFRAYYTAGVNDIGIGSELDKNRMYGISAGYLLGKGRNINKDAADLIDKGE